MTLTQAICAAYRLTQAVTLTPSRTSRVQMEATIGLRHEYDCSTCSNDLKAERGFCPYTREQRPGEVPQLIDSTGGDAHDLIPACPRGLVIRYPGLVSTVSTFHEAQNMGGAPAWYGPPLCARPKRIRAVYSLLVAAESRMKAAVQKARRQMDGVDA